MKSVVSVPALLFVMGTATAQEQTEMRKMKKGHRAHHANLTPEQAADLRTKKMALDLELTEAQQKEVYKINLGQAQKMESMKKERMQKRDSIKKEASQKSYEHMNARLEGQKEVQEQMKKVLNEAQYAKWKEKQDKRPHHGREKKHGKP